MPAATRPCPHHLAAALLLAALPVTSAAAPPCTDDAAAYCAQVRPGDGRLASCLGEEHLDAISEACRRDLKRVFVQTQRYEEPACSEAAQMLCFDAVLQGATMDGCLAGHARDLPPECTHLARPDE